MKNKILILIILIISILAFKQIKAQKPNFLFILADDLGYDDISYHGNKSVETPNIDKFASEAVEFTNFHSSPLCAPSRASLLTGRNFLKTGVWGVHRGHDFLNLDETTFAEVLLGNGYRTAMMGKWHSGHSDAWQPWRRGFEDSWVAQLYRHEDLIVNHNRQEEHIGGWATNKLTDIAIDYMKLHKSEKFFCYLPYMAPHGKWRAPKYLVDKYRGKGQSLELATVNAMIELIDINVGRLLKFLKESGLDKNTVVIFTSDNGPVQQTHGAPPNKMSDADWQIRNPSSLRGSKGTVWQNGHRVPFFVKFAEYYKPNVIKKNAHLMDMFPTILDLAGINISNNNKPIDGVSIKQLFEGKTSTWKDRFIYIPKDEPYWEGRVDRNSVLPNKSVIKYKNQVLSVMNQNYKYVKSYDGSYLFNIPNDPREENNLFLKEPKIADSFEKKIRTWYNNVLDLPGSYTQPRFLIGEKEVDKNFIYAAAVIGLKGNVKGDHVYTKDWQEDGDGEIVMVDVKQSGKYKISLDANIINKNANINITIGDQTFSAPLSNNTNNLGEMNLEAGKYNCIIELSNVKRSEKPVIKYLRKVYFTKID